jgi:hypothetical protein
MLMVFLLGVGACVSVYLCYKNKQKITFEVLKCYTYIDEYISALNTSQETQFLYPNNDTLNETANLKTCLLNVYESKLPFIITKDFLVIDTDKKANKFKTFYTIYHINNSDTISDRNIPQVDTISDRNIPQVDTISDRNIITPVCKIDLSVNYPNYEEYLNEIFFSNQIKLIPHIEWSPEIIAASISIEDVHQIYTFREYDITEFIISIVRQNGIIKLNNEPSSKVLWIYIFNFIFKKKHILIPIEDNILDNLTIRWDIILTDCSIIGGENINLDLQEH